MFRAYGQHMSPDSSLLSYILLRIRLLKEDAKMLKRPIHRYTRGCVHHDYKCQCITRKTYYEYKHGIRGPEDFWDIDEKVNEPKKVA
jgi:hypothetical protein